METSSPDPVDRVQLSIDRQWRKSRVFHIVYSSHYSDEEVQLAVKYINDPLAGQISFEQWKIENGDLQS